MYRMQTAWETGPLSSLEQLRNSAQSSSEFASFLVSFPQPSCEYLYRFAAPALTPKAPTRSACSTGKPKTLCIGDDCHRGFSQSRYEPAFARPIFAVWAAFTAASAPLCSTCAATFTQRDSNFREQTLSESVCSGVVHMGNDMGHVSVVVFLCR